MRHRTVSGKIRYLSLKPGREGQERGREWFTFTHHGDGSVIMRARCEIEDPDPPLLRDVVLHIGPDRMPRNLLLHLTLGDEFLGTGWMAHDPDAGTISCESHGPAIGRNSESCEAGEFDAFGTHPVVGDGFTTRLLDTAMGPHKRALRFFVPSPDHRGASAPQIARVEMTMEYVGEEERKVAAGTFACRHFRYVDDSEDGMGGTRHPDFDIWVTADDDAVLVYASIEGYMMNAYELVELSR
ncbi:DUF3108 domain-containing protein [Paraurantiacibacter namhicola]|uniref:DUF3108 domain-containing protein n=1 Tax=Paraurantiacibacter namhicola TaxID=645517 RepID=A0A1C7D500_9SPHN|nr:DUF3108 domain-containing protein [Paraurantiacibacter namhicola]ANU06383.1 hypothetical protein A6F65_00055 [Paraurantiacibacter namhicola]